MTEKETLKKWPKLYFNNIVVKLVLNRYVALSLSILFFVISYSFASCTSNYLYLTGSGSIISIVGLLLTLKHNFISDSQNPTAAFAKFHRKMGAFNNKNQMEEPHLVNPVIGAIRNEYFGIFMVIIGGLVSGYGGLIPIIK
jgi:hypothetical protein